MREDTYVGLLRGINVGGRRKVPMARLREVVAGAGFADVRTHLQSGNVVFRAPNQEAATVTDPGINPGTDPTTDTEAGLESRLQRVLGREFGFEVPCLVRTPTELQETLAACPWSGAELDPSKLLMLFLRELPAPSHFTDLDAERFAPDEFWLRGRVVYCFFPNGMGRSKLAAALEGVRPALTMTGRNWRTVQKLIELAESVR